MGKYIWNYMNDNEENRKFRNETDGSHLRTTPLTIDCYENAIVLPWRAGIGWGRGGIICEGKFIEKSKKIPKADVASVFGGEYQVNNVTESECEVIYAGPFYGHWGHLLVDCLLRLWVVPEETISLHDKKVLFIAVNNFKLNQWHYELLNLLGIDRNKIITVDRPTRFRKIYMPEESYVVGEYWTLEFKRIFKKIADKALQNYDGEIYDKIYLTRTEWKLGRQNGEFGEAEIEKLFYANGYKIISPQNLSVQEQIAILASSKSVACPMGTVAHAVALFGMNMQKMTICNKRCLHVPYQLFLNEMNDAEITYIDDYYSETPGIYWMGINNNMKRYVADKEFVFPYTKAFLARKYIENGIRYYVKSFMAPVYRVLAKIRTRLWKHG